MKFHRSDEHPHTFQVRCEHAQQVKLVLEYRRGVSQIFSLEPRGGGVWEVSLDLAPGDYRYCYHAYNGRTLTYLTPPDAPMDGLKARLHVGDEIHAPQRTEPVARQYGASLRPRPLDWARNWLSDEDRPLSVGDPSPAT